jgi:hypothetical protein
MPDNYALLYELITLRGWVARLKQNPPATIVSKYNPTTGGSVHAVITWSGSTYTVVDGSRRNAGDTAQLLPEDAAVFAAHGFTRSILPA